MNDSWIGRLRLLVPTWKVKSPRGTTQPLWTADQYARSLFRSSNWTVCDSPAFKYGLAKPRSDLTGILRGVPSGYVMYS